jgi:colanic acid/amylovoran biosynthesis protein
MLLLGDFRGGFMCKKGSFLLVGNGPYLNRGCEAIVRGTVNILRHSFGNPKFVNANFDSAAKPFLPEEKDAAIIHKPIHSVKRWTTDWAVWQVLRRINNNLASEHLFRGISDDIKQSVAALSIGGDNYSLDYGTPWKFINLDNCVLRRSKPLIIWGASVGPFDSNPDFAKVMHRHLKEEVTAIFVRERKSLEYLGRYGIRDNVYLMADPAFVMEPEQPLAETIGFDIPADALGVNLGPLMTRYIRDKNRDVLVSMSVELLENLRKDTDMPILLIPHVTLPHASDHKLLSEIYQKLGSKDRIYLLPDTLNAAQTKWVISKLCCLVASRTHATIAGFSSCVPTVSLAYSIKAYGINQDIFGHTEFVVSPEEFSPTLIQKKVNCVIRQKKPITEVLEECVPKIKKDAFNAGLELKKIINKNGA